MIVSVTCPNCGGTVVLDLDPSMCGGFCQCCYNCSANVTGSYYFQNRERPVIQYVRAIGGRKKW